MEADHTARAGEDVVVSTVHEDTEKMELRDGRQLAYREFGAPSGHPLLYCHGLPGSRQEPALLDGEAGRHGLRVIGLERPGYGATSPLPERAVGDEIADVTTVVDRLGLDRFDVIGFSGGGPQALACAAHLPHRVERVTLVASWAPFDQAGLDGMLDGYRQLWQLAMADFPAFARTLRAAIDEAGGAYELLLAGAPEADRALLAHPDFAPAYRHNTAEAMRQDMAGMLDDAAAVISPWPFEPRDVKCPVRILHGTEDGNAPVNMGRWLAARLPRAELVEWPGAMHFETFRRWNEVLTGHSVP